MKNILHGVVAAALLVLGIVFWPDTGSAQTRNSKPVFRPDDPSGSIGDCAEPCHLWLIEDRSRVVVAGVRMPFSNRTRRVRYAADWVHGQSCPEGRLETARRIVGTGASSAFLTPLFDQGFCPRATLDGISSDAPYLASRNWDDVVFDAERARMLTREEYDRSVVPPLRTILASQEPGRWVTFSLFVRATVRNADLLSKEISALLADPNPSSRQETADDGSAKAKNVLDVADWVTGNGNLVEALLNELDADAALSTRPGYGRLIDNLAGVTSSVPTWGSPPVCANVDRIARHLPWGHDDRKDATYLATLSRCDTGSENLLRLSLLDGRPVIVATALRVWWAAAATGRPAAANVAENVVTLTTNGTLPAAAAVPVFKVGKVAASLIREGAAAEEVALGLSTLGRLSGTVEQLNAAGRQDQARALFDGLEQGVQRLAR